MNSLGGIVTSLSRTPTIPGAGVISPLAILTALSASAVRAPGIDTALSNFRQYRVLRCRVQAKCYYTGTAAEHATGGLQPGHMVFYCFPYKQLDGLDGMADYSSDDTNAIRMQKFQQMLLQPGVRSKTMGGMNNAKSFYKLTMGGDSVSFLQGYTDSKFC